MENFILRKYLLNLCQRFKMSSWHWYQPLYYALKLANQYNKDNVCIFLTWKNENFVSSQAYYRFRLSISIHFPSEVDNRLENGLFFWHKRNDKVVICCCLFYSPILSNTHFLNISLLPIGCRCRCFVTSIVFNLNTNIWHVWSWCDSIQSSQSFVIIKPAIPFATF